MSAAETRARMTRDHALNQRCAAYASQEKRVAEALADERAVVSVLLVKRIEAREALGVSYGEKLAALSSEISWLGAKLKNLDREMAT
jgi:hypothetical protein